MDTTPHVDSSFRIPRRLFVGSDDISVAESYDLAAHWSARGSFLKAITTYKTIAARLPDEISKVDGPILELLRNLGLPDDEDWRDPPEDRH